MTSTDPALVQLRADAARTWSPSSADALLRHLVPDPAQLVTKDHLDLRLAAEFATFRGEVTMQLADLRAEAQAESARTEIRFGRTDSRFDSVDSRFDAIDSRFGSRFDAIDSRFGSRFDAIDSRFGSGFDSIDSRFAQVDTEFSNLRLEIASSADRLQVALHRDMISQTKWVVGALLSGIFGFGSLLAAVVAVIG